MGLNFTLRAFNDRNEFYAARVSSFFTNTLILASILLHMFYFSVPLLFYLLLLSKMGLHFTRFANSMASYSFCLSLGNLNPSLICERLIAYNLIIPHIILRQDQMCLVCTVFAFDTQQF